MQGVNIIIDALVHGLDAVGDINLPLEGARLRLAGKGLQLLDKLI